MSPARRPNWGVSDGKVRRGVPMAPFLRWRIARYVVLLVLLICGLNLVLLLPAGSFARVGIPYAARHAIWAVYAPLLVWLIRWFTRGDLETKRRLAAGELPCWQCGYDLSRQLPAGRCPECGASYDPQALRERWTSAFRRNNGPTTEGSRTPEPRNDASTPPEPPRA